jgi:mRNA interferase RelE/StbE
LDKPVGRRTVSRLVRLADNVELVCLERLTGELGDLYKLRVGDYRVLQNILYEEETIVVHAVGHRRDIYRR